MVRVYEELGYKMLELPLRPVEERVEFVLQNLGQEAER
jgi:predicted ATPase